MGPKIALVPFLEVTAEMDPATKALVVRKMLTTAGVVAVTACRTRRVVGAAPAFFDGVAVIAGASS